MAHTHQPAVKKTETQSPAAENKSRASVSPKIAPAWTNALGSQPVLTLQPKLTVNQSGDEYEQEADQVAAQVMRMAAPAVTQVQRCACGGIAGPDGECAACKANRLALQRKSDGIAHTEAPASVHQTLRSSGQPLDASTRSFMEPRFGQDFSDVRVHTDSQSAQSAADVSARAYTVGNNVVFGAGEYAPGTTHGQQLIAHELTHTVQQKTNFQILQRNGEDEGDISAPEPVLDNQNRNEAETALRPSIRYDLQHLYTEAPTTASALVNLFRDIDLLLQRIDQQLRGEMIEASALQMRIIQNYTSYKQRIIDQALLDAPHLSDLLIKTQSVFSVLRPILLAMSRRNNQARMASQNFERSRHNLSERAIEIIQSEFIQSGVAQRHQEQQLNRERQRIEEAVEYLIAYCRRNWTEDQSVQVGLLHGTVVAGHLVHQMHLNADQIRDVLDTLKDRHPHLLEAALFQGGTVQALLNMRISGLQAYRARGEGFLSGAIRANSESMLANRPGHRTFDVTERLIAVGGFIAGMFQGIGDSLIDNVKGIFQLFTPSFWKGIYDFLTDFLPNFINDEDFRFQLGQMMGQADASEEQRLLVADPFDYGLTIGHIFGTALTEIVLSFVGLGWILKAFRGSQRLMRIARPLIQLAQRLSRTAIVARGLRIAETIGEGINALNRKLRQLRNRLPALTAGGRLRRELQAVMDAEHDIQEAMQRVRRFEERARAALSAGDEQAAQRHLADMNEAIEEMERRIAAYERQVGHTPNEGPAESLPTSEPESPTAQPAGNAANEFHPRTTRDGRHSVRVTKQGRIYRCSPPPCEELASRYAHILENEPTLRQRLAEIQNKGTQAAQTGNSTLADEATQEAIELEHQLAQREAQFGNVSDDLSLEQPGTTTPTRTRNRYPDFAPVASGVRQQAIDQAVRLSQQLGIPIPQDRILTAPWVGRIRNSAGELTSVGTSQGWLRNESRFWSEFRRQFPSDYALLGPGQTVSPALAQRYGWQQYIGDKLVHHHMENGQFVVAIPESIHHSLSGVIHSVPTVIP